MSSQQYKQSVGKRFDKKLKLFLNSLRTLEKTAAFMRDTDTRPPSDEELVTRFLNGDIEAFGTLYNRYCDFVLRICKKKIRYKEDAEDVAENTFLRALQKIHLFGSNYEKPTFKGWIAKITLRRIDDHFKSRSPKRLKAKIIGECYSCEISELNPYDSVLEGELKDSLVEAISALPYIQRNVFIDYHIHKLSTKDICQVYGLTKNQVAHQRRKACLYIEQVLRKKYPDLRFWKRGRKK
jgi:RNA polymerase sigma-70 factor (ECF subfamily)